MLLIAVLNALRLCCCLFNAAFFDPDSVSGLEITVENDQVQRVVLQCVCAHPVTVSVKQTTGFKTACKRSHF